MVRTRTVSDRLRSSNFRSWLLSKQAVSQYLIDSILQKRRTVQRSENLWDRSLYNAGTDTPPNQREPSRRCRLDTEEDDESTPGTSGSSTTPRRRLSTLPEFAKPPAPSAKSPAGKRGRQETRKASPFSPLTEDPEDDEPTQLYARQSTDRRSRTIERRTAAHHLPTTFEDEEEELDQHPRRKNKRPLVGPPTAKNKVARKAQQTRASDSNNEEDHPPPKGKMGTKPAPNKHRKKLPTVVSSDSDLDDDQLGITPRTPPESPFYRGLTNRTTAAGTSKKNTAPSTTTPNNRDRKGNTKQASRNPKEPEQPQEPGTKKKKNRKGRGGLEDLADEQDKLYAQLNKTARNTK